MPTYAKRNSALNNSTPANNLLIVAFDLPYPPDYGGVIVVWNRLLALKNQGAHLHLFTYQYGKRKITSELIAAFPQLRVYQRSRAFWHHFSFLPFIMQTRQSQVLLADLARASGPILFEGHHTAALAWDKQLRGRHKVLLVHNIEWQYYRRMADSTRHPLKRFYYLLESWKLKRIENKLLEHIGLVVTMTSTDAEYYRKIHPRVILIPAFHGENAVENPLGIGKFALFHGNLSVEDNDRSARWLIQEVWTGLMGPLIIAGKNPSLSLVKAAGERENITLVANPDEATLEELLHNAHINLVVSFQKAGVKLKLLRALFRGRFCLANPAGAAGSGLENCCIIAETAIEFRQQIAELAEKSFSIRDAEYRRMALQQYDNPTNAVHFLTELAKFTENSPPDE